MEWYTRAFIRSSVSWLALGVTLGLVMTFQPSTTVYRTAHMHMLLLGFVAMMIFGFAYHVVPRLAGNKLARPGWARAHVVVANGGLLALAAGFLLRAHAIPAASWLLPAGGTLATLGAYMFAANILLSTRAKKAAAERVVAPSRRLPTLATSD
jgi:heme/copper-type cytochrome/quinol oxidase subunit 1